MQVVDVRDLADLHLRAMESPGAVGHRFLAVADFIWMREIAQLLRSDLGDAGRKVTRRELPDWLIRALALVQPEMSQLVPMLGRDYTYTTAAARNLLGWQPRPVAETIRDTGRSLVSAGLT